MAVSLRDIVRISGEYDPTAVRQLALNDLGLVNLGAVGKCSNLMVLSINRNNIQDLQPLAKMENLEVLHASENRISSLQSLSNMILLRDLRLEGNPLPSEFSIVLEQIKGLQNLERLDIASEEFPCQHDIDIQLLHVRFPKLKIINGRSVHFLKMSIPNVVVRVPRLEIQSEVKSCSLGMLFDQSTLKEYDSQEQAITKECEELIHSIRNILDQEQ